MQMILFEFDIESHVAIFLTSKLILIDFFLEQQQINNYFFEKNMFDEN